MDAMLREKAAELAKEIAVSISTQQELSDVMRLMTKSVIERMLDAEMDVHLGQGRTPPLPEGKAVPPASQGCTVQEPVVEAQHEPPRNGKRGVRNRRNGKSAK